MFIKLILLTTGFSTCLVNPQHTFTSFSSYIIELSHLSGSPFDSYFFYCCLNTRTTLEWSSLSDSCWLYSCFTPRSCGLLLLSIELDLAVFSLEWWNGLGSLLGVCLTCCLANTWGLLFDSIIGCGLFSCRWEWFEKYKFCAFCYSSLISLFLERCRLRLFALLFFSGLLVSFWESTGTGNA